MSVLKARKNTIFAGLLFVFFSLFTGSIFHPNPVEAAIIQPFNHEGLNSFTGTLRVSPSNPRYFSDESGKIIYLTGSHTWANLQDAGYSDPPPVFDYNEYLDFLQANNHNFFRLWMWEQAKWSPWTPDDMWFDPTPYQRTGTENALDGQPKFDLADFNQAYFDRMRERIIEAGNRGIYVSVMLFDGFSVGRKAASDPGNPWTGHPFNISNNINGINGDPNGDGNGYETQDLSIPDVTAIQEAYIRKVIDTVNDLDNVLYEICNECNSDSTVWQYHMIDFIHEYEKNKPKQHPVGMTVEYPDGNNDELFNSNADWISPNDDGMYKEDPPVGDGSKVIITDTDHLWGVGGDRVWVWKSFLRGLNPIFMDCYNSNYCEGANPDDPSWVSLRLNLGYTLKYSERINMAAMVPRPDLCSTEYCLANPGMEGAEYLVYVPEGNRISIDLSGSPGQLNIEWFDPQSGTYKEPITVSGGGIQSVKVPFSGDAVLYIFDTHLESSDPSDTAVSSEQTPTSTSTVETGENPSSSVQCATTLILLLGLTLLAVQSGAGLGTRK